MQYVLAGLMGLFLTSALALTAGDMSWRILLAGSLLFFGIKVAGELAALEKKRDELRGMELVGSGSTNSFDSARRSVLDLLEATSRDGRVVTTIKESTPGIFTWELYRAKVS